MQVTQSGLTVNVRLIEALGTETVVHASLETGAPLIFTAPGHVSLIPSQTLQVKANVKDIHFFDKNEQRV